MHRGRRRGSGFQPAGAVRVDDLGLPRARARQLRLAEAWRRVAGDGIARRVAARAVHRGLLELEVPTESWVATLIELLPRLAGRLAAEHPDLRVRRFRLHRVGGPSPGPSRSVPEVPTLPAGERAPSRGAAAPEADRGHPEAPATRLARLAQRYLARRNEA